METSPVNADYDPGIREQYFIPFEGSDIFISMVVRPTQGSSDKRIPTWNSPWQN